MKLSIHDHFAKPKAMTRYVFTLLALMPLAQMELALLSKFKKSPNCQQYTSQLTGLFGLMCNNLALGENVARDACSGCFRAASTSNNNQPSLADLNDCAEIYLTESRYEPCINEIDPSSSDLSSGCVTGYCQFVRCIRRMNSDLLIAECYVEASSDNDQLLEEDQVILVKNITSCILARSRCSSTSPITGQQQTNRITTTTRDKWGKPRSASVPLYNSLQITPDGDLRIIGLPGTTRIQNYFCTTRPNLQESSWMEFSC